MSLFDTGDDLYRRREGVDLDASIGREAEYEALRAAVGASVAGGGSTVVVTGPAGSGKTTLVRTCVDECAEDAQLAATEVDCASAGSAYRSFVRALNADRPPSRQLSSTGYSFETLRSRLLEALRGRQTRSVLLFDGVQALDDPTPIGDLACVDGASVVCIADVPDGDAFAVPSAWSDCSTVEFHAYSAPELREVLSNWAASRFASESLSPEVIPLCAGYGAEAGGDAREALSLLRRAGELAEDEQAARVLGRHVQAAKEERDRERLAESLQDLDVHGRLLVRALVSLAVRGETPVRSATVRERYATLATDADREPLTERRTMARLRALAGRELVAYTEHNEGRSGGVYREYELVGEADVLESLLARDDVQSTASASFDGLF